MALLSLTRKWNWIYFEKCEKTDKCLFLMAPPCAQQSRQTAPELVPTPETGHFFWYLGLARTLLGKVYSQQPRQNTGGQEETFGPAPWCGQTVPQRLQSLAQHFVLEADNAVPALAC